MDHWILDEHGNPVVATLMEWAAWFETANRILAVYVDDATGWRVSTVFLGLDHNFSGHPPPILWETMIFAKGLPMDGEQRRYAYRDQALKGHEEMVALFKMEMEMLTHDK